ncbi:hypothetical protein THAOC_24652, partial [Thalassiosira oceanica]
RPRVLVAPQDPPGLRSVVEIGGSASCCALPFWPVAGVVLPCWFSPGNGVYSQQFYRNGDRPRGERPCGAGDAASVQSAWPVLLVGWTRRRDDGGGDPALFQSRQGAAHIGGGRGLAMRVRVRPGRLAVGCGGWRTLPSPYGGGNAAGNAVLVPIRRPPGKSVRGTSQDLGRRR